MSKVKPLNGYLVLKPVEEQELAYGNIVIPDLGKERPEIGEVLATSSTYNYHSDKWIDSQFKIGEKVLIPKLGATRITVEGDEYYICKEQDAYAVLVDDSLIEAFRETKIGNIDKEHYFVADANKINQLTKIDTPY